MESIEEMESHLRRTIKESLMVDKIIKRKGAKGGSTMLGRRDIEKELGKGICIYPFIQNNIKENSINLSAGEYAWTLGEGEYYIDGNEKARLIRANTPAQQIKNRQKLKPGDSAISKGISKKQIILLPHQTTLIETKEVMAVDNRIGGTLHSKVGIAAEGVGHIGTMLGPCYCGHFLIPIHNITNDIICIPVGSTFVSVVFHYLNNTEKITQNSNISGHVDKFSNFGIRLDMETTEALTEEWKQTIDGLRKKMAEDKAFNEYQKKIKQERAKSFKKYINFPNAIKAIAVIAIAIILFFVAKSLDDASGKNDSAWINRYWTVISTCVIVPLFSKLVNSFTKS